MFKHAKRALIFTAAMLLLTACQEQQVQHPAMGSWNASMVSNGVIIDIGTVELGANDIYLPSSKVYRSSLDAQINDNTVQFSDPSDARFSAKVRVISENMASMQMAGISGYIELTREG